MKCRLPSALARGRASASAMVPPSGSPPRMKQNHHLSSRAREAIFRGTDTPDRQKPAGARPWPDRSGRAVDDELISPGRPFFFEKCMASQGRTSQQISHRRPKHDTPLSLPAPHRTRHLADSRWRPPIHQHPPNTRPTQRGLPQVLPEALPNMEAGLHAACHRLAGKEGRVK